jgi:hypothetical protein
MSDYEWMVALAAKGMAERDNHPMPKSVTTPEAFYEVMARAALDAIGLQSLLEELAGAVQELEKAEEGPDLVVDTDAITTPPTEGQPVSESPRYELSVPQLTQGNHEMEPLPPPSRPGRTRKAANARLRH